MSIKIADFELFKVDELSEMFDIQERTIRMYIREGKLKARKLGKRWYVSSNALRDYFETALEAEDTEEESNE